MWVLNIRPGLENSLRFAFFFKLMFFVFYHLILEFCMLFLLFAFSLLFLIKFLFFKILGCSIIEFHDFIQLPFKHNYPNIKTGSKIFDLDPIGLGWVFQPFFEIMSFLSFHSLIFYLLKIELQFLTFYFILYWVITFSFDLLRIDLQIFFPYFSFYKIISFLCS